MTQSEFQTALDRLSDMPFSYQFEALPSQRDKEIAQFVALYRESSRVQRARISSALDRDNAIKLNMFAERMAMLSVRQHAPERLLDGLIALVMIDFRLDRRDILMVLSLVHHSAHKLGLDVEAFFERALQYAYRPIITDSFRRFLQRSPKDKRIETMGYEEIEGPSGLIYWHFGDQPIPEGLL